MAQIVRKQITVTPFDIKILESVLEMHARELSGAQHDARIAQQAASEARQAEAARKARGRLRRAWDGWRGR